jgi:hypothetical protein
MPATGGSAIRNRHDLSVLDEATSTILVVVTIPSLAHGEVTLPGIRMLSR